mgnify:CR=1 FL=1
MTPGARRRHRFDVIHGLHALFKKHLKLIRPQKRALSTWVNNRISYYANLFMYM